MGSISLQNVSKLFGEAKVIPSIDLDIHDGEFVVFVGPSGCGKSTLLRLIAGLEDVSGGRIVIDGNDATEKAPAERGLAMVFQSYALYPHMSVRNNIAFPLKMAKLDKAVIDKKVDDAARILNLTDYLERRPSQLSGGQRQRVAIGRAIVREPKAFLFDEPLSNLDAALRGTMRLEISELHNTLKTTMIYVTHDQVEAMTMADKIVVLHDGVIEQIGAPLELYDRPANLFVAGFIGSPAMNFIRGRVEEGVFRTVKGLSLPLPANADIAALGGRDLVYGVRPEHIRAASGGIEGRVELVEGTGSEIYAKLNCKGDEIACLFRERLDVRFGDTIHIAIDPEMVHLFDKASGKRI